jgi:hypothetical protein
MVLRGREALDGGAEPDHGPSHSLTERLGIKAAIDLAALVQEGL